MGNNKHFFIINIIKSNAYGFMTEALSLKFVGNDIQFKCCFCQNIENCFLPQFFLFLYSPFLSFKISNLICYYCIITILKHYYYYYNYYNYGLYTWNQSLLQTLKII